MIDKSTIYENPVIPQGFYFAKLIDLELEEVGAERPLIWAKLRIGPFYDNGAAGSILTAIIHPTEKADKYYLGFRQNFNLSEEPPNYTKALSRWGCIWAYATTYKNTTYAAVRFCYQPIDIRLKAVEIRELDEEGKINWDN